MSNSLRRLVPAPELCQKIPDDKFQDSALVHAIPYGVGGDGKLTPALGYDVFPRDVVHCDENLTGKSYKEFYGDHDIVYCYSMIPAPTLAEFLEELRIYCSPKVYDQNQGVWFVETEETWGPEYSNINPATAALELWLKLHK